MNTVQSKSSLMNFLWGLIIGLIVMGSAWYFYGDCKVNDDYSEAINLPRNIPLDSAKIYYNYYKNNNPTQFKSLPFSKDQILELAEMLKLNPANTVNYFNLYKGKTNNSVNQKELIMVIGGTFSGKQFTENPNIIYTINPSPQANSPCPPACDNSILD